MEAAGFSKTLKQTDYLTSFEAYSCYSGGEVQGPSMLWYNDISFIVLCMKTLTDTKAEKNWKSSYISGHFDVITSIVSFLWEYTTAARDVTF